MAGENNQISKDAPLKEKLSYGVERFKQLPPNAKYGIMGLFGFFLLMFLMRGGGEEPIPQQVEDTATVVVEEEQSDTQNQQQDGDGFAPVGPDRTSLRRGFVTQQTQALQQMREEIEQQADKQQQTFRQRNQELKQLQNQLQETMNVLSEQMKLMEESNQRQREEISRLAEEARRQGIRPNRGQEDQEVRRKTPKQISETRLSSPSGPNVSQDDALLQGVARTTTGRSARPEGQGAGEDTQTEPRPFIPPLGFVRGTLLNGVDALAGAGLATPALVRLSGTYKTAMNSTVTLDGCFMLVEFEGDISTERARGSPSRMTCVYPDRGAVTYDVAGYVVDAEDGIEGVPGLFYEGDSGRIALAMAAEFASGIANVVQSNQQTTTVGADGEGSQFLTGDDTRAAVAGGVSNATSRLTDFLLERAERITPFIRLDALRKIHVVLLSGTELRTEGSAWSLLFNANNEV